MSKGKWKGKCLWKKLRKSLLSRKSTRKHDDAEISRSTQSSTSTSTSPTTPSPSVINRPCNCICHCNSCPSSMDSSNPKYAPNAPPLPQPYDPEAPTQPFLPQPQPPYQNNNNTAYGVPVHHHHQYQYHHHNQHQPQHHQYVNPSPPYIPASPTPEWSTGLCDCCSDVSTCLAGCLCPCFLLGRIAERLDGSSASCLAASLIWYLLQQTTSLGCLYSCGFRRRIRDIYGIRDDALPDCITHFVCWPCAFCQEYRELKIRQEMEDEGWGYGTITAPPEPQSMSY